MFYRIINLSFLFVIGCSFFNKEINPGSKKYFLGITNTKLFQKHVEQVMLENGFSIEYYDNDAFSANIITRWRTRDPYPSDLENGFLDTKIRLIIKGLIKNNSYQENNGFKYECYLTIENKAYDGNGYVHYLLTPELTEELNNILSLLREKFDYYN